MNASHNLKGAVSVFGAKRAVDAAQILESMGREGEQDELGKALALLEREMALLTFALEEIAKEPL
jgi:hypothetical protein